MWEGNQCYSFNSEREELGVGCRSIAGPHRETNIQPNMTCLKLEGRIYIKMMNGQRITDSVRTSLPSLRVAAPPSP